MNSPLAKLVGQLYSILGPGLHENLGLGCVCLLVSAELIPEHNFLLLSSDMLIYIVIAIVIVIVIVIVILYICIPNSLEMKRQASVKFQTRLVKKANL